MATIKLEAGSVATLMDTELNSLANGSAIDDGGNFDNSDTANLFMAAGFELTVTFGSAPTQDGLVHLYLIPSLDGTNFGYYTTGAGGWAPSPTYVGSFMVDNITTIQRLTLTGPLGTLISLMPCKYKAWLLNNSGQAFPSSGSLLKILPFRYQSG